MNHASFTVHYEISRTDKGGSNSRSLLDLSALHGRAIRLAGGLGQCLVCGKRFSNYSKAVRHVNTVHSGADDSMECYVCKRSYKNDQTLKEHLRAAHKIFQRDLPKSS